MNPEALLKLLLRLFGTSSLLALIFVAAPYSWMDSIHASLGMGRLADQPVVGYLARSTSAFYALLGGLFWLVSFDLRRHRQVVMYLGGATVFLGLVLLVVDWWEGLPFFWKVWEGPLVIVFGVAILLSIRSLPLEPSETEALVHRLCEAWNSKDTDAIAKLYAPDATHEDVGSGVKLRGMNAIRTSFRTTWQAIPDLHTEVTNIVSRGEWVAWEWTMTATHSGDFPDLPASGHRFSIRGMSLTRVGGDRIRRQRDYYDQASFRRQLGAL